MPVTGGVTRNDYIASDSQTVFAYTLKVLSASDLKVLKDGVELTVNNDYNVSNVGNENGGNVILTVGASSGSKLSILLAMPITRTTEYQNAGDFLASDVNADFDKAYLAMNQLETDIDRSIGLQDVEPSANLKLPLEADRANKTLGFDASGDVIVTTGGNETLAQTLVLGNVTGGTDISVSSGDNILMAANSTVDGRDVSVDGTKLDGIEAGADVTDTTNVVAALSAGTGITLSAGGEIANSAPDQTVALTGAGGTAITGTYPNFTITSTDAGGETLAQTLALGNRTSGNNIAFGDNDKATFGAGDDLQIFHTGSYSAIKDVGTGALFIGGDNYVDIGNGNLSQTRARFYDNTVELRSGGSTKLATTPTGIDVTGTATMDGLTVDGDRQHIGRLVLKFN